MARVKDKHIKYGSTHSSNLYDIEGMLKWKQVFAV